MLSVAMTSLYFDWKEANHNKERCHKTAEEWPLLYTVLRLLGTPRKHLP